MGWTGGLKYWTGLLKCSLQINYIIAQVCYTGCLIFLVEGIPWPGTNLVDGKSEVVGPVDLSFTVAVPVRCKLLQLSFTIAPQDTAYSLHEGAKI